jgi:hypothetical protein
LKAADGISSEKGRVINRKPFGFEVAEGERHFVSSEVQEVIAFAGIEPE